MLKINTCDYFEKIIIFFKQTIQIIGLLSLLLIFVSCILYTGVLFFDNLIINFSNEMKVSSKTRSIAQQFLDEDVCKPEKEEKYRSMLGMKECVKWKDVLRKSIYLEVFEKMARTSLPGQFIAGITASIQSIYETVRNPAGCLTIILFFLVKNGIFSLDTIMHFFNKKHF